MNAGRKTMLDYCCDMFELCHQGSNVTRIVREGKYEEIRSIRRDFI